MKKLNFISTLLFVMILLLSSCASFRSDVQGNDNRAVSFSKKNNVRVFFDIAHYRKNTGYDVIPKLIYPGVEGFTDIFRESVKNLSNTKDYELFTNYAGDVENLKRRMHRDSCITRSDYTIHIEILRQKSYVRHFFSIVVSSVTATIVPMAYTWKYSVNVTITNKRGETVSKLERNAKITTWYEFLLFPLYPFFNEEKQTEYIYQEMLTNIFRQIENDNILK